MVSGSQLQVAELAQMCPETPSGTQMVLNGAEQYPRSPPVSTGLPRSPPVTTNINSDVKKYPITILHI